MTCFIRSIGASAMLVIAASIALLAACSPAVDAPVESTARAEPVAKSSATESSRARAAFGTSVGFKSRSRLNEHFEKHGEDFGAKNASEYLALAQSLRDAPLVDGSRGVRELVRADGVVTRFDRRTGAFLAFDADGTIRTFFKPNDGERYFERQAHRELPP